MEANLQDRIRAARWQVNVNPEHAAFHVRLRDLKQTDAEAAIVRFRSAVPLVSEHRRSGSIYRCITRRLLRPAGICTPCSRSLLVYLMPSGQ